MSVLQELEDELRHHDEALRLHSALKREVEGKIQAIKSAAFIEANGITREQVEFSTGQGKPWFSNVWELAEWLKENPCRKWCEWNTGLYLASDLKEGRLIEAIGYIGQLPE
mgnify:CR=1 FL=1